MRLGHRPQSGEGQLPALCPAPPHACHVVTSQGFFCWRAEIGHWGQGWEPSLDPRSDLPDWRGLHHDGTPGTAFGSLKVPTPFRNPGPLYIRKRERVVLGAGREFELWEQGPDMQLSWKCTLSNSHIRNRYKISVFLSSFSYASLLLGKL